MVGQWYGWLLRGRGPRGSIIGKWYGWLLLGRLGSIVGRVYSWLLVDGCWTLIVGTIDGMASCWLVDGC